MNDVWQDGEPDEPHSSDGPPPSVQDHLLAEATAGAAESVRVEPPKFGAVKGLASFALLLFGQFFAGMWVILVAMVVALLQGRSLVDPALADQMVRKSTAWMLVASGVVSAVVVYGVAHVWAWSAMRDPGPEGVGWRPAPRAQLLGWGLVGAVLAVVYVVVASAFVPLDPSRSLGPLATAASSGGINRIAWVLLALVFAPVVEELFFRGLLLSAFGLSWGRRVADVVVTLLFISLHLFETMSYWPATLSVAILSVLTLAARRVTGSLVPSIALHSAYNLVIVLSVFIAPLR